MAATPGWYPVPDGRLRYWDGVRWTEHFAPAPVAAAAADRPAGRSRARSPRGPAVLVGWGTVGGLALLGLASSGVSGLLVLTGLYAVGVAVVALVRGHVGWARLRGRAAGGLALGAAVTVVLVGGATAARSDEPPSSAAATARTESPSSTRESSSPSASATSTPTPTPTPTRTSSPSPTADRDPVAAAAKGTALAAVAALAVKGRAPKTGYDRSRFGQAWYDLDRNGCDTRNDVLRRDLDDLVLKAGTNGCLVLRGTLADPYTGRTIAFVRGTDTSAAVQVDHVVSLSDAWQKGAQGLGSAERTAFANDPLNLLAVDGPTNAAKGDGDTATWLPPRKSYRCAFVARQVAVKVEYGLWVTAAERDAMVRVLRSCPAQKLPTSRAVPLGGGTVETVTPPQRTTAPRPTATTRTDPRFDTCKAAIAAGYGPYVRGKDPEYDWYWDRDQDGVVCER